MSERHPSWGSDDRYYASRLPAADQEQRSSETLRRVTSLLDYYDPHIHEHVERACKQWNLTVRDSLRSEMALRLSVGEDTQAVPVRIAEGLPRPFEAVLALHLHDIWFLLNGLRIEQTLQGLRFVHEYYDELTKRPVLYPLLATRAEIQHVYLYTERLATLIRNLPLVSHLGRIDQDILGAYFFRVPRIDLYWRAIGLMAALLGISVEALTVVAITHELAHAYTHLGRDVEVGRWDTEAFAHAELPIVEGLAQFYTGVVCSKLDQRLPAAKVAYERLLEHQAAAYTAHRGWTQPEEAGGEIVRLAMIQARTNREVKYETFRRLLEAHRQTLNRGRPLRKQ